MSVQDLAQMNYLEHSQLSSSITNDSFCKQTKTILVAQKTNGDYQNVGSDYNGDLRVSIGNSSKTAFGELNVSSSTPIIQELFSYNIDYSSSTRKFVVNSTGGGNAYQSNAMLHVSTSTTSGSTMLISTSKKIRYRPGMGVDARFTAIFTPPVAGTTQMIGLGEDDDGLGFMFNTDQTFNIIHRSKASGVVVDTLIPQSSWNNDKADGTATLPIIDWTKGNVYRIQLQYLGMGIINFFLEEPSSGNFILLHSIHYANTYTIPSLNNPSLPISMKVDNGVTSSDIVLKCSSMSCFIEGKSKLSGLPFSVTNSKSGISATETNILTIRNKTLFHGESNHNEIYPRVVTIATLGGTKPVTIFVTLDATLGGSPSYTSINTNESLVEYDTAGTTVSNGTRITTFVLGKEDSTILSLADYSLFLHEGSILTISASTPTGSVDVFASITWVEDT